ncbi:MAG: dTDP-4-dehydrorhamnose reductase [Spirochaetes bacterium RBG_13_51_14]|nr:MAG: dTDP-4-dehydrorhamnose reductase [Spirochaetes bacterium RBG_13_51_14]
MIWLIGNRGMLGSDVEVLLKRDYQPYIASDIDVDITDFKALRDFIARSDVSWIINCSAYTAVDNAEDERDKTFAINADGAHNIACVAAAAGAALVHVSTDYVFDGEKSEPYLEEDTPNPIGVYGLSKLAGERHVASAMGRYFIIRTAWLYGHRGNNFVRTMLRLFSERDEVRVVADQWGSPTFTKDLAAAIISIISGNSTRYGIYHFTNEGRTTWYDFAREIYTLARNYRRVDREVRIIPITTEEYPTKVKRPRNSYLSKDKIRRVMGIECRDWRDALEEYVREMTSHPPADFSPMPPNPPEGGLFGL